MPGLRTQTDTTTEYEPFLIMKEKPIVYKASVIKAVANIIWMARRYAHGRKTYAPSLFNDAYDTLRREMGNEIDDNVSFDQQNNTYYDITLEHTRNHPYAMEGHDRSSPSVENHEISYRPFYKPPAERRTYGK